MKCVIIANGDLHYSERIRSLIRKAGLVICADGGARHLRALEILPHVLIGDFDSIDPKDRQLFESKDVTVIPHPPQKDRTDSELCVSWAIEHDATDITLLGVTGARLDHTLANIFLLEQLARQNILGRIINQKNEIHIITDSIELTGRPGDFLSVIPITRTAEGITLKGLAYPLSNATIRMGSSLGISNVFTGNAASVSLKKGMVIVTKSED